MSTLVGVVCGPKDKESTELSHTASAIFLLTSFAERGRRAGVELLDEPLLQEQLIGLVVKGAKIDHQTGEHDDRANAAAGALIEAISSAQHNLDGIGFGSVVQSSAWTSFRNGNQS